MHMVPFLQLFRLSLFASLLALHGCASPEKADRLNVLVIVADDLNWSSVGAFGSPVADITPNIDRLASEGMRFDHAHVTVAVCQPSRGALATGRYPHKSGIEGFFHTEKDIPTIVPALRQQGYFCGILSKVEHSSPRADTPWDYVVDMEELGMGRDKDLYVANMRAVIDRSRAGGRPFYLMLNANDPHRPFAGSAQEKKAWPTIPLSAPSRSYGPSEVAVPDFLPDLPEVRLELAEYYSSVKRLDDLVGSVLGVLHEEGLDNNTLVMFLSDNGMAFPFAKTNCYLNSTKTPWIVRWPGRVQAGAVDDEHFISGIDFFPTILASCGIPIPEGLDGTSFLPLLDGNRQADRSMVFTQFFETSARNKYPIRCVQDKRYGYIYNFWADGEKEFRNESQMGRTWNAMTREAKASPGLRRRVQFFSYRTPEEFYDLENDPDALHNLIGDPDYQAEIAAMKSTLLRWMETHEDPEWSGSAMEHKKNDNDE